MKLSLREPEEDALRAELAEWSGYVSSALLVVEAIRACSRYSGEYGEDAREWLVGISLLPIDDRLLEQAIGLHPLGLRTLDAIHLATALSVRDEIGAFIAYDQRLAAAASDHDLNVVQPA